jgi:hypothetical protein
MAPLSQISPAIGHPDAADEPTPADVVELAGRIEIVVEADEIGMHPAGQVTKLSAVVVL